MREHDALRQSRRATRIRKEREVLGLRLFASVAQRAGGLADVGPVLDAVRIVLLRTQNNDSIIWYADFLRSLQGSFQERFCRDERPGFGVLELVCEFIG